MSITISGLFVYPIKSCGGVSLRESELGEGGLRYDRNWMVVDADGKFITQRTHPKMALVRTELKLSELVIRAPGMLRLDIIRDVIEDDDSVNRRVKVWKDEVDAVDEGDLAAHWFSTFLGVPCRLVKIHPDARRISSLERVDAWREAHPDDADLIARENVFAFADGFPLLIANQHSLEDLNRRLREGGHAPIAHDRFRPNIVLSGLDAFEEDYVSHFTVGDVSMALVKPCTRCEIPNTDQHTGDVGVEPMATLAGFRAHELGITYGVNAVVKAPAGAVLKVGDSVEAALNF
jgi:uncharacterized protein YcbX